MRPGAPWGIERNATGDLAEARIVTEWAGIDVVRQFEGEGPTPALALITALLESLSDG